MKLAELEIRNLHVKVEDKQILRGIDLDVQVSNLQLSHVTPFLGFLKRGLN